MPNARFHIYDEATAARVRPRIDGLQIGQKPIADPEYHVPQTYGDDCVLIDEYDRIQEVNNWRGVAIRNVKRRQAGKTRMENHVIEPKCMAVFTGVYNEATDAIIRMPRITGFCKGIESHGGNLKVHGGHIYGGAIAFDLHEYATLDCVDGSDSRICFNLLASGNVLTGCYSQNGFEHCYFIDGQSTLTGCKAVGRPPTEDWPSPVCLTYTPQANFTSDIGGMTWVPTGCIGLWVEANWLTIQRTLTCAGNSTALRLMGSDNRLDLNICALGQVNIDVSKAGTGNDIKITGNAMVEVIGKWHESNKILGNVRRAA